MNNDTRLFNVIRQAKTNYDNKPTTKHLKILVNGVEMYISNRGLYRFSWRANNDVLRDIKRSYNDAA